MTKFNKHVVIVGSARSGTSWLGETLARPYRYRMLFEPDQETRTKEGYLLCDQWITERNQSLQAYNYLKRVFKNRVDCNWIAQNSNRQLKRHLWPFVPKKFIIKFVRFNLSAQFINSTFQIPVIHLIRNPYHTIRSQKQVKFPWLFDLSRFIEQHELVTLINDAFGLDISLYKNFSEIEILCLRWCIENCITLELFSDYKNYVTVLRYEDLVSDSKLFRELCKDLNFQVVDNLEHYYQQPSSKTHPKGFFINMDDESIGLTQSEINSINKILNIFKTELYPIIN